MIQCQTEEFLDLTGKDDHRDPGRKADRHGEGDELDEGAEPEEADSGQHQTRQESCEDKPVHPVQGDSAGNQDDEGTSRATDLESRTAQERDQEATDDCRIETLGRGRPRSNGDRHRQRQRDDGNGQTGNGIRPQLGQPIAFAQDRDEFRGEEFGKAGCLALSGGLVFHLRPHL